MTKEQVVQGYLMNSPKVVAEMLYETIERYRKLIEDNGAICVDTTTTMFGRIEYFKGNFILDFEHSIYAKIILEENIEDLW